MIKFKNQVKKSQKIESQKNRSFHFMPNEQTHHLVVQSHTIISEQNNKLRFVAATSTILHLYRYVLPKREKVGQIQYVDIWELFHYFFLWVYVHLSYYVASSISIKHCIYSFLLNKSDPMLVVNDMLTVLFD